ncbi:MAG: N-formylglutamate amidohydrolase [Spirochaetia bacterium]|nr:N-formylglutamate amidohydrolase [Spirochaetia bacterium]
MSYLLLTCEHAVNFIPGEYSNILCIPANVLNSHLGYDEGALDLFKFLSKEINCTSISGNCSRLLIDLNRSESSKSLFSKYSGKLALNQKQSIVEKYYFPYRRKVEHFVSEKVKQHKKVIHVSIHSFTPIFNNKTRKADIGLLYDPDRSIEVEISNDIRKNFLNLKTNFNIIVRRNYPYRGVTDGMTSYLRKKFKQPDYAGIELEINQRLFKEKLKYDEIKINLSDVLKKLV